MSPELKHPVDNVWNCRSLSDWELSSSSIRIASCQRQRQRQRQWMTKTSHKAKQTKSWFDLGTLPASKFLLKYLTHSDRLTAATSLVPSHWYCTWPTPPWETIVSTFPWGAAKKFAPSNLVQDDWKSPGFLIASPRFIASFWSVDKNVLNCISPQTKQDVAALWPLSCELLIKLYSMSMSMSMSIQFKLYGDTWIMIMVQANAKILMAHSWQWLTLTGLYTATATN